MALPSSPPLLAEENDLPVATTFLPLASGSSISFGALQRKRQYADYDSLSSDPVFSDTTEDDEAQDIERPRRKKVVRGPWWHVGKGNAHDLRRGMAKKEGFRNADSGVWMGSDVSESSDSVLSSRQRLQELAVEGQVEDAVPARAISDAETYAARIIQTCLDRGEEAVDLSDMALRSLSDSTVRPLHQLIKSSFTTFTHAPSEDEFSPLTPSLTLILSRNRLASLPAELFNLSNITCLSLRNNELEELPSAIVRLTRLTELNVSGNNIQYLPWELLDLMQGGERQILVRPNPLLQPADLDEASPSLSLSLTQVSSTDEGQVLSTRARLDELRLGTQEDACLSLRRKLELRLQLGRILKDEQTPQVVEDDDRSATRKDELIYLASSHVRYLGVYGSPLRRARKTPPHDEEWPATMNPTAHAPTTSANTHIPSLFELALRSLQATHNLADFLEPSTAAEFEISPAVASAMHRAARNSAGTGNENCSSCGKHFIIARAEWVEYWFNGCASQQELDANSVLPFMRRVCSWGCAKVSEPGTFRC
ncbi:hypothetical protein LTR56_010435 [Elasticomyces elasticus]|nr:hypothetical protein LTR56_010435 [Elasticomyces elasticus]KAK3648473.1 hypothetical protein LTR22_013365 [Elasticomyces elasticus]KAK4916782.1 hypothetical protein LTR49_015226 [Elasticomyces elasticus]KAK5755932.1 hypothetical protein LTS12_013936 [Elasticomyces elasticus]